MSVATVPPNSAVARITSKFLSVGEEETVGEIKKLIVERAKEFEVVDYIYVVDESRFLHGVVSLKDVLRAHDDVPVKKIMKRKLVTVDAHADQERIIYLVLKNKLKSIPVVDSENRLSGVVPYYAILSIFHHEFREDILKSGGIHHIKEIEDITTPVSRLVRAKLPSLALGLIGGQVPIDSGTAPIILNPTGQYTAKIFAVRNLDGGPIVLAYPAEQSLEVSG